MHRQWLYRWLLFCISTFTVLLACMAWSGALDDLTSSDWSGWFWVTWVFVLLVGIVAIGWVWPLTTTIIQLASPAELRGRVLGVFHLVPGFHLLGAWPLTLAAVGIGWPLAITGAAAVCLTVTLSYGLARKGGRELASHPASRVTHQGLSIIGEPLLSSALWTLFCTRTHCLQQGLHPHPNPPPSRGRG